MVDITHEQLLPVMQRGVVLEKTHHRRQQQAIVSRLMLPRNQLVTVVKTLHRALAMHHMP